MHYGLARHFGANVDKHLEEKENMDDQVNIKFLNMQGEINTLKEKVSDYKMELKNAKAWIEQVGKSEASHANTVIRLYQEFKEFKTLIEGKVLRLEECEDLRDDQMKVLQKVITNLMEYIEKTNNEKENKDDQEFQILDIPKATK